MSAILRLVPKNDHDDAELTATSAPTGFEATNTQNTVRGRTWDTANASTHSVTGVWSASRTVSHFSMHHHLCHSGNFRLQLFSDAAATAQVYDSVAASSICYTPDEDYTWSEGSNNPFYTAFPTWIWFSETAARSYKLTLSGTPGQAYWRISRIFIGRYFEASYPPDFGLSLGFGDITDSNRSMGASLRTNLSQVWRTLIFDINRLPEAERATWNDITRYCGKGRQVVVSIFPGEGNTKERDHTIAGQFNVIDPIIRPVGARLTKRVQIVEN